MAYDGYSAYSKIANTIDSKEVMLLKLLEGALRFLQNARRGLEAKDPRVKGEYISRVIAIISELNCALDREMGGSLVENLSDLYKYIMNRLTIANLRNDDKIMAEVEDLLTTIKEGFSGAIGKQASGVAIQTHAATSQPFGQKGFSIAA